VDHFYNSVCEHQMNPKLSVVICTYNRVALLKDALRTVCEQSLAPATYEVIVVDNHSSDDTHAVVMAFAEQHPQVRYCYEPNIGLSHARNRGWQEAKGEYVIYIDDDSRVPAETLAVAYEIVEIHAPTALGGAFKPFYQRPKPRWFKDSYAQHIPFAEAQFTATAEWIFGGIFGVQRTLLAALGGFDPTLGMVGGQIGYGEETAFFRRLMAKVPDARIYYDPKFLIYHLVRPEKMTWRRVIRERLIHGRYGYRIRKDAVQISKGRFRLLLQIGHHTLWLLWRLTLGSLLRDRAKYPFVQNYWFEASDLPLYFCGFYYEAYCASTVAPSSSDQ
jgi:glucosyl-dolichyl phosphate glucuronosyltransferase